MTKCNSVSSKDSSLFSVLSREEVQQRLDEHYGGKLTVIDYKGLEHTGILHCKDCGTFETKHPMRSYLSKRFRSDCERCEKKNNIKKYDKLYRDKNIVIMDYKQVETDNSKSVRLHTLCKVCGYKYWVKPESLSKREDCPECKNLKTTQKYKDMLAEHNCVYISRSNGNITYKCNICGLEDSKSLQSVFKNKLLCTGCMNNERIEKLKNNLSNLDCEYVDYEKVDEDYYVHFKCNKCGFKDSVRVGNLHTYNILCNRCNPNSHYNINLRSYKETLDLAKTKGKLILNYKNKSKFNTTHLFCGHTTNSQFSYIKNTISCKKCLHPLKRIKDDYDNSLVREYLTILYNIRTLKNFLLEHNQLDKLPDSQPKQILEHIDGWITNYIDIVNEYPHGDLVAILENNHLYLKCKDIFYPIMKRYNLEIKE